MKWIIFVFQSIIALFFIGIGSTFVWIDKSGHELNQRLNQRYEIEGQITTAQATEKHDYYTHKRRKNTSKHVYYILYHFPNPSGNSYINGKSKVRFNVFNQINEGDIIKIEYIKSDPSINRIWKENREYSRAGRTIGFIMIVVGFAIQSRIIRRTMYFKRLSSNRQK